MYLLGIRFQPRMSSPNDRRLYAFEAKGRYGVLAPFMGEHLDRKLIEANWDDVQRVITAFRNRVAMRRVPPRQKYQSVTVLW